ncbi:MAG: alkaline phosphatase family protein [Chryseolinea sp.]
MIKRLLFMLCVLVHGSIFAQETKTKNVVIITLDGFRWQEVFQGADSAILFNKEYVTDMQATDLFWNTSSLKRRETLLPFFWNVIGAEGQLYGNRGYKNQVNCANPHWFSYPGYSELLVGFVDKRIRSNHAIENPNSTILDFVNQQPGFENKVAAFATWEVMSSIAREQTNHIPVNAGKDKAEGNISEREVLLNELSDKLPNPHGARYDAFTFQYAFEYLKRKRPRFLFISFDETDEHGHSGRYDAYLKSAHRTDEMIEELWTWIQLQDDYKDQTTLIITTDHGRGSGAKNSWKNHGRLSFGSSQMWFAILGPDTPALGEIKTEAQYFQKQIARTAASVLGLNYSNVEPVGETIHSMISSSILANQRATTEKVIIGQQEN